MTGNIATLCHKKNKKKKQKKHKKMLNKMLAGGVEAWRLARRLCVQEIKLPNAHYLSKGSARFKVMKMAKLC